jgi:phenylpyruvate tautomerase PptA (4-oxalocrotonate tautomerase family)
MPLVNVKIDRRRFHAALKQEMIRKLTTTMPNL